MFLRLSQAGFKTLREAPHDAETISHQLMMRAGYLKKVSTGIFTYSPLMTQTVLKASNLLRDVLNEIGWQEIWMPVIIPSELWKETGRWELFGDQLLKLKDRKGSEYCVGPTHEEVVSDLARSFLASYKQLPFSLYQIQTKFRDEIRPRFGVMRAREFLMMDGYSFHSSYEHLDEHYDAVRDAYCRYFDRLGLQYRIVEADTGAIGGSSSHEFHVLANSGEDLLLWCDQCSYASNIERTERKKAHADAQSSNTTQQPKTVVATPGCKTIEDLCRLLKISPESIMKSVILENPLTGERVGVALAGNLDASYTKVAAKLGWAACEQASPEKLEAEFGIRQGGFSPLVNKLSSLRWIFDQSLQPGRSYLVGTGDPQEHFEHVILGRDLPMPLAGAYLDVASSKEGEPCARCDSGIYKSARGIEVGHIFKLGQKYSKAMNVTYLDAQGQNQNPIMGTYGIGVTRVIAAALEQNYDKDGIRWTPALSPYDWHVVVLAEQNPDVLEFIDRLKDLASEKRLSLLIDDREAAPGVKFKDADLIGCSQQMVIGRGFAQGQVEIKNRMTNEKSTVDTAKALSLFSGA